MRIYITHCGAKKDDSLKGTGRRVTPDLLYTATPWPLAGHGRRRGDGTAELAEPPP